VFEIAKSGSGYGVPTTLATFTGSNGASPFAGLIADAAGNLFGTTGRGGASGDGTVFEIAKTGSGYSAPTTLATFTASPGVYPYGGLIADTAGNLFGTTEEGGAYNAGTVFEIAKSGSGYSAPTTLASFTGSNGASPFAGLIADAAGNLFGTTGRGGASGAGTVFEIAKTGSGYSAPTTLASFTGSNGQAPVGGLVADAAGDLFGTTEAGGAYNLGMVFEIAKTGSGYSAPTTLATFTGSNGQAPAAGLVADAAGNLFGTTQNGGASNYGTVFEVTNSGFVSSPQAAPVPEPASMALLATGLIGIGVVSRRKIA